MSDSRGVTVVFNGELYDGSRTGCDTRQVLDLYGENGASLPQHLHGMFAVAVWDPQRRQLSAWRDRFGEKPLFWATAADGTILMASEAQALASSGQVATSLSRPALLSYLRRGWVPPTHSIHESILPLPPGHGLTVTDGEATIERWWSLPTTTTRVEPAEAAAQLREALTDAVTRQSMSSDRPVATLLSGGLDSTTVAMLAGDAGHRSCFSFGFADDADSEVPQARQSASELGLEFHEVTNNLDPANAVVAAVEAMDDPLGDPSVVPTWLVSRAIAKTAPVVLGGDGADELLGGYLCWGRDLVDDALAAEGRVRTDPPARGRPLLGLARSRVGGAARSLIGRGKGDVAHFGDVADRSPLQRWQPFRHYLSDADARSLELDSIEEPLPTRAAIGADGSLDDVGRWDLATYLPGDILTKTDRMSMAHGLEMRSPFLDPTVSDLLLGLHWTNKISSTTEKVVLRDAFADRWPATLAQLPKQGFGAPRDIWLASGSVRDLFGDTLASPNAAIHDHLPYAETRRLAAGSGQLSWSLGILALWLERNPGC